MSTGFTLIELLCVLVVLALGASLGVSAVGNAAGVHAAHRAELTTREMLERARLLADRRGGAILELGATLVARPVDHAPNARTESRAALPRGWSVDREVIDVSIDTRVVQFAADGSCDDMTLRLGGPNEQVRALRVLGLSGQVIDSPAEGPR